MLLSGSPVLNVYREEQQGGRFRDGIELLRAVVPVDEHITQARRAGVSEDAISLLLLKRYMIRRLYSEVQPDLPKKIRENIEVPLDKAGEKYLGEYLDALSAWPLRANDDETQAPRKFRLEGVGELSRGHAQ